MGKVHFPDKIKSKSFESNEALCHIHIGLDEMSDFYKICCHCITFSHYRHIRSMSPKFTLVAMIALLVRLPAGFFLALSFSALEYGINPRTQVAMCGVSCFG